MKRKKPGPPKGQRHKDVKRTPLGENIYKVRNMRGLTQEELGTQVGLSQRMIAHYEVGSKAITVTSLLKIAKALNVNVSELLAERTPKEPADKLKPSLRKRMKILKSLPEQDQKAIFRMIDLAAERAGIKKND